MLCSASRGTHNQEQEYSGYSLQDLLLDDNTVADRRKMCCAVQDVGRLLAQGSANRRTGTTNMNQESSRSHSVFTCVLEMHTTDASGITHHISSRLNLVDLAGKSLRETFSATVLSVVPN